ncbi:MAG: hypothetical protein IJ654_06350 [Bacteroidales bacterium]|nr:hypothetical protein [Bacteroidales bacterium]
MRTKLLISSLFLSVLLAPAGGLFAQISQSRISSAERLLPGDGGGEISVGWKHDGGSFHRPDAPEGKDALDVHLAGDKASGAFVFSGSLDYTNAKERGRNWNSLIGNDPDNPYIICDSIADRSTTESFVLDALLAWQFAPAWRACAEVGLTTATLSDTRDPRPQNDISRIPLSLRLDYRLSDKVTLGLSGGVSLFQSKFRYALEEPLKTYRYFKMMGMGEYFAFASSENSSAPREYSGRVYSGGVHLDIHRAALRSTSELTYVYGLEDARDGGSAYEWKGGDYRYQDIRLRNVTCFGSMLSHSFRTDARLKLMNGFWYDQKRQVDTEHGNITWFEIQSYYKNNSGVKASANLRYTIADGASSNPSWSAFAEAGYSFVSLTHYTSGDPRQQRWNAIDMKLGGTKTFLLGKGVLSLLPSVSVRIPFGGEFATGTSQSGKNDITGAYVLPIYAYETAKCAGGSLRGEYLLPFSLSEDRRVRPGIAFEGNWLQHLGHGELYDAFDNTGYGGFAVSLFIRL